MAAEIAALRRHGWFLLKAALGGYVFAFALIMANYFLMLGRQPHLALLELPNWDQLLQDRASYVDIAKLTAIVGAGLSIAFAGAALSFRAGERSRFAFVRELVYQARRRYSPLRHIVLTAAWLAIVIAIINAIISTPLQLWYPHGRSATAWFGGVFVTLSAATPIFAGLLATGLSGLIVHSLVKGGRKTIYWIVMCIWAFSVVSIFYIIATEWVSGYNAGQIQWAIGINLCVLALLYFLMLGSHLSASRRTAWGTRRVDIKSINPPQAVPQSIAATPREVATLPANEVGLRSAEETTQILEEDDRNLFRRFIKYYILAYIAQSNISAIHYYLSPITPGWFKQTLILGTAFVIIRLALPGRIARPLRTIYVAIKLFLIVSFVALLLVNAVIQIWNSSYPIFTFIELALSYSIIFCLLAAFLDGSIVGKFGGTLAYGTKETLKHHQKSEDEHRRWMDNRGY